VSRPPADLEAISSQLDASNPELYRHLALYLQVLRQVLPTRVEQAIFHLATQLHPDRYASLPDHQRERLHHRIRFLVRRCSSLLTVEQLAHLADQMDRERRQRSRRERLKLLRRLADHGPERTGHGAGPPPVRRADPPVAEGSVQLGMSPPSSSGWHGTVLRMGRPRRRPADRVQRAVPPPADPPPPPEDEASGEDEDTGENGAGEEVFSSDAARAMVQALGEALEASLGNPEDRDDAAEGEDLSLWALGRLPREPTQLLKWLVGMEDALARRLRNLSHALNVDLLRAGLTVSLLPVNLLDAVLAGEIDTMAAPANLLRLQIPLPGHDGPQPLETVAVLLQKSDIEMEEPRLRTCRRRIEKHRQEVVQMARRYQHLCRRLRSVEAARLWVSDLHSAAGDSA
jgi:hypothetical protein